jgi:hypothetical protein
MTSPTTQNIRTTITITPEVHSTFQRLSKATGMSMSKALGEWLSDTLEAAEFMAEKVEQARAAPGIVMREMHAYALGLADETGSLLERVREKGRSESLLARDAAAQNAPPPRPVIRGGKSPQPEKVVRAKKAVSPMKFPLPAAKVQAYADNNGFSPKAPK